VTPEQVAYHDNEQLEPWDEHEHREGVGQEIPESEAFREEEHRDLSVYRQFRLFLLGSSGRVIGTTPRTLRQAALCKSPRRAAR
jgi:hypothetical protein